MIDKANFRISDGAIISSTLKHLNSFNVFFLVLCELQSLICERWQRTLLSTRVSCNILVDGKRDHSLISFLNAGSVDSAERAELLEQKVVTIWLTGLSASGKVT